MNANRRQFIKLGAAVAAAPFIPWTQKTLANVSKNDRPQIGCIGLGGMGSGDARQHNRFGDIAAICDVDRRHVERAKNDPQIGNGRVDSYADYRELLDRHDIDVVSIATPDHWHVKIAIEALKSGKHVFCQKPLTLTLEENQLVRNACHAYPNLVFFVGTQQRSDRDRFLRAINMVHKGLLGKIQRVIVGVDGSPTGGPFPVVQPPRELDWNMWLGQAPFAEYREKRCHYEFRWWYEYSGGKFTDWGAHHVDVATWALKEDAQGHGPIEIDGRDAKHPVSFKDGFPTVDDSYNTSHDFDIKCSYGSGVELHITSRSDNGVLFEGAHGRLFVNRKRITGTPIDEHWDKDQFGQAELEQLYRGKPFEGHKENFYRCIREGGLGVSDPFSHVQTMNTCHLAAIAARLGRVIKWDPKQEKIVNDDEAATFFSRKPRPGFEIPRISNCHQASGVKVGEVTDTTAIIWVRRTRNSLPNAGGAVFDRDSDEEATAASGVGDPATFKWAVPGALGKVRVLYGVSPELSGAQATPWTEVNESADYQRQFLLTRLKPGTEYFYACETQPLDGSSPDAPCAENFKRRRDRSMPHL